MIRKLALAILLATPACASLAPPPVEPYRPLRARTTQGMEARWRALEELARSEGWNIQFRDQGLGVVAAWRSPDSYPDVRERVEVMLFPDVTVVEVQSELRSGRGWHGADLMCAEYSHARESQIADRLDGGDAPEPQLAGYRPDR